jgi:hypothetical protein
MDFGTEISISKSELRIVIFPYIKIGIVLVLHFNPWVEASAGGLLVPEDLFSPVAKYFGTCLKIRI